MLHGRMSGMLSGLACSLWSMILESGVAALASGSSSEGKSPSSGLGGSSYIGCGAYGRGGGGDTSWVGGWMGGGVVTLGARM